MSKKDKAKKKVGNKAKKAGEFSPSPASGTTAPAEATGPWAKTEAPELDPDYRAKQDAEVARQWAHRAKIDYGLSAPTEPEQSEVPSGKAEPAPSTAPETRYAVWIKDGETNWRTISDIGSQGWCTDVMGFLIDDAKKAGAVDFKAGSSGEHMVRWKAGYETRWKIDEAPEVPAPKSWTSDQIEQVDPVAVAIAFGLAGPIGLEPAADPVLANGLGQAMIHFVDPTTGKEKVKGYTRVTTYIDGLDDKTVLNKWKQRTLLEGAAIDFQQDTTGDGGSIASVGRALQRLDAALQDIDRREAVEGELLELRRQELLKEHRDFLESIGENLMDIGGAHDKATKGTNLHRLTELVDQGLPLPDDTTASDRRDVEAYQAKVKELGLEVLWTEKRVVLDDIQVSGTMDRAYLAKLPGMARRIRVVGDLKTGSVSWGQGKIACQLGLYSKGFGYDWAKPLEREPLRLSKAYGLLIHLPQGEGKCDIYVVDLELASEGLALAAKVREWRRTQKRAYDLHSPMQPATIGSPPPDATE